MSADWMIVSARVHYDISGKNGVLVIDAIDIELNDAEIPKAFKEESIIFYCDFSSYV